MNTGQKKDNKKLMYMRNVACKFLICLQEMDFQIFCHKVIGCVVFGKKNVL